MPIYEFICQSCQLHFEELVAKMGAKAPPCPKCQSNQTQKRLSVFSAHSGGQAGEPSPCGKEPDGTCQRPGCAFAD